MEYELAKQLKDAGFPQVPQHKGFVNLHNADDSVTVPTLEELIEACGEDFVELRYWWEQRVGQTATHKEWRAGARILMNYCVGKTPTEAVARLWLALHNDKA